MCFIPKPSAPTFRWILYVINIVNNNPHGIIQKFIQCGAIKVTSPVPKNPSKYTVHSNRFFYLVFTENPPKLKYLILLSLFLIQNAVFNLHKKWMINSKIVRTPDVVYQHCQEGGGDRSCQLRRLGLARLAQPALSATSCPSLILNMSSLCAYHKIFYRRC